MNKVMKLASEWLTKTIDGGEQELREAWNELKGDKQVLVVATLQDIASLKLREAAGQNITPELAIATATLQNMGVVVQIKLYRGFLKVLQDSLKHAGSILTGVVEGLLGKIIK